MKNKIKLSSLLILLVLFTVSCQKENVLQENEISPAQAESNSRLKTTEDFEFGIELFTQDEPDGPVVPAAGSIIIESDSSTIYTGQLVEGGNRIYTSNEVNYTIIIEKEGYVTYQQDFTYAELEVHKIQRYTVPLEVILEKENLTVTDCDENVYQTVKIGNQIWMAENLKTTKYNDCTDIPIVSDEAIWRDLTSPGGSWYDNSESNKELYGGLYNRYALETGKLCPIGWHVPTDEEWLTLINYLGGEHVAGGKLKEIGTVNWNAPNTGATNEYGFTALPGGFHSTSGSYLGIGGTAYWWSNSPSRRWFVHRHSGDIYGYSNDNKNIGLSIRCVKD